MPQLNSSTCWMLMYRLLPALYWRNRRAYTDLRPPLHLLLPSPFPRKQNYFSVSLPARRREVTAVISSAWLKADRENGARSVWQCSRAGFQFSNTRAGESADPIPKAERFRWPPPLSAKHVRVIPSTLEMYSNNLWGVEYQIWNTIYLYSRSGLFVFSLENYHRFSHTHRQASGLKSRNLFNIRFGFFFFFFWGGGAPRSLWTARIRGVKSNVKRMNQNLPMKIIF